MYQYRPLRLACRYTKRTYPLRNILHKSCSEPLSSTGDARPKGSIGVKKACGMAVFIKGKTQNLVLLPQKSGKVGKYKYYTLICSIYIKPNSTLLLCSLYGVRNRIAYALSHQITPHFRVRMRRIWVLEILHSHINHHLFRLGLVLRILFKKSGIVAPEHIKCNR